MFSKKRKVISVILFVLGMSIILVSTGIYLPAIIHTFQSGNSLVVSFASVEPNITKIASSNTNSLFLKATVHDLKGYPQRQIRISAEVISKNGIISPSNIRTNTQGEAIFQYQPLDGEYVLPKQKQKVLIRCNIGNKLYKELSYELVPSPIVFVHGYRETASVFSNMEEYLTSLGYSCYSFKYDSTKGIANGAKELSAFLLHLNRELSKSGFRQDKFTLITHSMGGLVARYYTTTEKYLEMNTVENIIFISVPHAGSHMAVIGQNVYNDLSLKDLDPDGNLFKQIFPNHLNHGLHPNIPIGNILGEFDEVVTTESGSLDAWDIKSEIFRVGENQITVDNIFTGKLIHAQNHHSILNNRKVFEKVSLMLQSDLPKPQLRN